MNRRFLLILAAISLSQSAASDVTDVEETRTGTHLGSDQARTALTAMPAGTRLGKIMAGLPPLSLDDKGLPDSPVNLLIFGSERSLRSAISDAKWTGVSASMVRAIAGGLLDLVKLEEPARFPPISPEYLFGRQQDMAFAQLCTCVRSRHHFRLWRSPFSGPNGEPAWAGTAAFDEALEYHHRQRGGRRAVGFGHRIDPKVDNERDYIMRTLSSLPQVSRIFYVPHANAPLSGFDADLNPFETDGRVLAVFLR
jgi:hypothetical protein